MSAAIDFLEIETDKSKIIEQVENDPSLADNYTFIVHKNGRDHTIKLNSYFGSVMYSYLSSTGYRSLTCEYILTQEEAELKIESIYQEMKDFMFLVWEEHREHGWSMFNDWKDSELAFRIPKWVSDDLKEALIECGASIIDQTNHGWAFDNCYDRDQVKECLAPLLAKGSRHTDQSLLAKQLRLSYADSDIRNTNNQLSLF